MEETVNVFSKSSKKNLKSCHADLQRIFNYVLRGFDCTIVQGVRDEKTQNKYFKEKKTQLKYPKSKHNKAPSMAVDVVPYPIDWKDGDRMKHFAGYVKGIAAIMLSKSLITHSVRWGGDWDNDTQLKDNKFQDYPHFELYIKDE